MPPLQPGLPVLWCPTIVVYALAAQLRRCGLPARPPRGLLDDLVAPWGCKRVAGGVKFRVPCDCGRVVRYLELARTGWLCSRCRPVKRTQLEILAGRLLFGLRIGARGRFLTRLHGKVVRRLLGQLPRSLGFRRFAVVQAATVVVSYDPQQGDGTAWHPLGLVGRQLAGEVLNVWLEDWASPVVYRARCLTELGL